MKKLINEYLSKYFRFTIPEFEITSKNEIFFFKALFKNNEITLPFITKKINNIYVLDEIFFNLEESDKYLVFNQQIYRKFDLDNRIVFYTRLFAFKHQSNSFYFFTNNSLFIRIYEGYFSNQKRKSYYSEFFDAIQVGNYENLSNYLLISETIKKHIFFLSGGKY